MFKIKTVAPAEATGQVAEIYAQFPAEVGVPHAIQMMSASPDFLGRKMQDLKFWQAHPTLTPVMQRAMRMLISGAAGLDSCRDANAAMLRMGGLAADQSEIDRLCELGWSDAEIFEALAFGGMVLGVTSVVAVLKK